MLQGRDANDRLFTVPEAVADPESPFCRMCSARTAFSLIKSGKLAAVHVGRRVFLTIPAMRAFIAAGGTGAPARSETPTLKVVGGES